MLLYSILLFAVFLVLYHCQLGYFYDVFLARTEQGLAEFLE